MGHWPWLARGGAMRSVVAALLAGAALLASAAAAGAVEVASVILSPTNVPPSGRATATVRLTEAVTGSTNLQIDVGTSDAARARAVAAVITVSPGSREATVLITTQPTAAIGVVEISATRRGSTMKKTTLLTIRQPNVAQLLLGASPKVQAGDVYPGSFVLETPAGPDGLVVNMGSSDRAKLYIAPWNPRVAPGERTGTFKAEASSRAAAGPVTVTAKTGGSSVGESKVIEVVLNRVTALSVLANAYAGGSYTGRVDLELSAPTAGLGVALTSSSPFVKVPASVYVKKGERWATFTYTGESPGATQPTSVTIKAVGPDGVAKETTLTARPQP
jgi:hypothetical protein